jgi:DNA-binding NtrC family response regulator
VERGRLDLDILIQGPSGCGKTSVVEAIHKNGIRADKPLRVYNSTKGEDMWDQLVADVRDDVALRGGIVWIDELQSFVSAVAQQYELLRWPVEHNIQIITASSSEYAWLKDNLVGDFSGRYCMRVFEVGPLRERQLDFREFTIKCVSRTYNRNIAPALVEKFRVNHEWPQNLREVMNFCEELIRGLPSQRVTITEAVVAQNLSSFGEPVLVVLRKIPEFRRLID